MKNVLIKNKELCERQSLAAFFKDLSEKIVKGQVTFQQDQDQITIAIPERVQLRIYAKEVHKKRRTRHSLRMAMSWIEGQGSTSPVTLGE